MWLDALVGRVLTKVEVFDSWQQAGGPATALPLFGALALSFGDVALFCKSPLRYCREVGGSILTSNEGISLTLGYRIDLCDLDQLEAQQSLLESVGFNPLPKRWQRIPPPPRTGHHLHNGQDIERVIGQRMAAVQLVTSPDIAIDLIPGGLRLSYRADLDGTIQLARPGWHYRISEINLSLPEHAFGWLLDAASYPVWIDGKCWNSVEHYATSFDAELLARTLAANGTACAATRISAARTTIDRLLREKARLAKFVQHPQLALRLGAIRYPVFGKDGLPFLLPSLTEIALARESGVVTIRSGSV